MKTQFIIIYFLFIVISYLVTSFIAESFNIIKWWKEQIILFFICLTVLICVFTFLIVYAYNIKIFY